MIENLDQRYGPDKWRAFKEKMWVAEFRWMSKPHYNMYPKHGWKHPRTYTDGWIRYSRLRKHPSAKAVEQSLLSDARSKYMSDYIKGRFWRAHNIRTGETVDFPDILKVCV